MSHAQDPGVLTNICCVDTIEEDSLDEEMEDADTFPEYMISTSVLKGSAAERAQTWRTTITSSVDTNSGDEMAGM